MHFWRKRYLSGLVVFAVAAFFLAACAEDQSPPLNPTAATIQGETIPPEITILAFGDSLTEGFGVAEDENYPTKLENKLREDGFDVQVINGGISGETTTSALSRVEWMLGTNPDIVIVETGANDALRGVDISVTEENIDAIVSAFTENDIVVIVAGLQIIQNLGEEYTTAFAEIYPAVAEKYGAILIPFVLEGVAADPALNQPDFIHPTGEGYTVMVDHLYPFILEAIELLK